MEFKKGFEIILEQEKSGYIEQLGSQWIHFYSGRVGPLVSYYIILFISCFISVALLVYILKIFHIYSVMI